MLGSLHKHRLVWICRQCNIGRLLDANQTLNAVQISYAHRERHIFTVIGSQCKTFAVVLLVTLSSVSCVPAPSCNCFPNLFFSFSCTDAPNFYWTPVFTFMGRVSIVKDQMDINSLFVCAIYFGVDVLNRNPALTRLPQNAYSHLFMKYVFGHFHVDEAVVRYIRSVTMNVVGASSSSSFGATSQPAACSSSSSSLSSLSLTKAGKTLSASADERRSLETKSAGVPLAPTPVSKFLAKTTPAPLHANCGQPARRSKLTLGGSLKDATVATTRTTE